MDFNLFQKYSVIEIMHIEYVIMKSLKYVEKSRECDILSGWGTNKALTHHSVSLLAMSVSWADILCILNMQGGSLRANLLRGSFILSWKICWFIKNIFSCCQHD